MDMEFSLGRMEEDMKDITKMIKRRDMAFSYGMMENNIKAIGKTENKMERENSFFLLNKNGKRDYGKMVKELNGFNFFHI